MSNSLIIRKMSSEEAHLIRQIDRSETIEQVYAYENGVLQATEAGHECANWDERHLIELMDRFVHELNHGGIAYGVFDGERLAGFGVLAHQFRGNNQDQLQVDLMYVSREYRRRGIGSQIMSELKREAINRGAKYLYISSTETQSAVHFYKSQGSDITEKVDPELFSLEPKDIHMIVPLFE